jgi:two-component system cell cycle response regulator DivK
VPGQILIVEDHRDSREILKAQLETLGYEVIEARDGEESVKKAQASHPDIIVMDLGLPKIGGIEAACRLKANPKTRDIPIIAYTAWSREEHQERAFAAGIIEYLTKPASPQLFKRVIERLLQRRP